MFDRFNVDAGLEGTGEIIDPSEEKRKSRQQAAARQGTRTTVLVGADGGNFGVSTRRATIFGS